MNKKHCNYCKTKTPHTKKDEISWLCDECGSEYVEIQGMNYNLM